MIQPFVDIEWVRGHLDEVILADSRWYTDERSGREAYRAGHIPGAVFVDLDTALTSHEDAAVGGRHPLAEPEDFAAAKSALGIGDDDTVIAYDDAGGVIAARLVWMLRVTDHEAALLDGGLQAWDGELEAGPPTAVDLTAGIRPLGRPRRGEFTARPWPAELIASIEEVAELAVLPTDVVNAADRRPVTQGAVRSTSVVVAQEGWQ